MLTFNRITAAGVQPAVYCATADTADSVNTLYYLAPADAGSPLTLDQIWGQRGAFVVAPTAAGFAGFPTAALEMLASQLVPRTGVGPATVAWLPAGASATRFNPAVTMGLQNVDVSKGTAIIGAGGNIAVGPATVQLPAATNVRINSSPAGLTLTNSSSILVYLDANQPLTTNTAVIAFDGPCIGAISPTLADTQLFPLFAFCDPVLGGLGTGANGPDIRYYLASSQFPGTATELRFPLFAPASQNASNPPSFPLQARLDPVWPFDPARTVLTLPDLSGAGVSDLFAIPFFNTVAGKPITLTAQSLRLYFAQNYAQGQAGAYVAPMGTFAVEPVGEGAPVRLLCGLLAQEHLLVNAGDAVTLTPNGPALVVGSAANGEAALVSTSSDVPGTYQTSWMQYAPAANLTGAYYAQPQPSVSFGHAVGLQTSVQAVEARLGALAAGTAPFPMVPYAASYPPTYSGTGPAPPGWPIGVTGQDPDVGTNWPNGATPALAFAHIEHLGLAPARYGALFAAMSRAGSLAPAFESAGTTGHRLAAFGEGGDAGPTATTRQGFVVKVTSAPQGGSPAGSWTEVVLASYQDQILGLTPASGPVLDPTLVSTLLANQLFLVADKVPLVPKSAPGAAVTASVNPIEVGGFAFDLNSNPQQPTPQVLVFKFNDALSLGDLINQTALWNQTYLQDAVCAQKILRNAVKSAQAGAHSKDPTIASLFADFVNRVLVDPTWTGVIAFNCAIDASDMPPSIQILIAAAVGQTMTAHHFGVEVTRVSTQGGQQPAAKQSSLFGVIAYDAKDSVPTVLRCDTDPAPTDSNAPVPFGFWTQQLHVLIHNSSITQFQAKLAVMLNQPFGRAAAAGSEPHNAITLAGAYQQQGKTGTVSFSEAEPGKAVYAFDPGAGLRVLKTLAITSGTLVPGTASKDDQGTTTYPAQIVLGGTLVFAQDPFGQGVDLFGFGNGTGAAVPGLDFTGFALDVKGTIDSSDKAGPTMACADYSGIKVSAASAAVRPGSLVHGLPVQVDAFLSDPQSGLSGSSLHAQSVHCVQLENITVPALPDPQAPSGAPPATRQVGYTTSTPTFAVSFDLPLGSLGGLADGHASLDASLILGWGPNPATTDDDAVAVFVKLPFASVGYAGFNLQGVLKTVFGDANLLQVKSVAGEPYVILFNNVQLSVFGFALPPHVLSDLILFVPGTSGPLGMCLMAQQT